MELDAKSMLMGWLVGSRIAREHKQEQPWETLVEGEITTDPYYSGNGYMLASWGKELSNGVNILAEGDALRVTLNGTVYNYTVQLQPNGRSVFVGNQWLAGMKPTDYTDDGTDFYLFETGGNMRSYVRYRGTYTVKYERKIK